jgi:hypothetical protein
LKISKHLLDRGVDINELHCQVTSQIDKLRSWCSSPLDILSKESPVSLWKIKDHLEHLTVTGRSTIMLIEQALQNKQKKEVNRDGRELFQLGVIPRGKTKSPVFAKPKDTNIKKIQNSITRFQNQMTMLSDQLKTISKHDGTSEHPLLGYLTPKQWLQFVLIHQNHHLEIISDIINSLNFKTGESLT